MIQQTNRSGIYKITNLINNKVYIGSASKFVNRWATHKTELTGQIHKNPHLQRAWNKYKAKNFKFEIIHYCPPIKNILLFFEQHYLDIYWDNGENCYNICKLAESSLGRKLTKEQIAKRSGKNSCKYGIPVTQEIKDKISKTLLGRHLSKDTCEKMSRATKGRIFSEEHRKHISERRQGKALSEEHRKHLSEAWHRRPQETKDRTEKARLSPESRAKMSKAFKGRPLTEETKLKISQSLSGRKQSQETIDKRAATCKATWAERHETIVKERNRRQRERRHAAKQLKEATQKENE